MIQSDTFGDIHKYKSLAHLADEVNKLSPKEQIRICSLIHRKSIKIKSFDEELKSKHLRLYVQRHLRDEILQDFTLMELSSITAKHLALNFLITKLKRFLNSEEL